MSFIDTSQFGGQNWMATPVANAVNEPQPSNISDQRWMLVLTGVVVTDEQLDDGTRITGIHSNNPHDWRRLGVRIRPGGGDSPGGLDIPLSALINRYGIPSGRGQPIFSLDQFGWAPFATISSFFEPNQATSFLTETIAGAGVAIDRWRPTPFDSQASDVNRVPIANVWRGIDIDVAVFGQSVLHRISYNISLVGKIVFGFYGSTQAPPPVYMGGDS